MRLGCSAISSGIWRTLDFSSVHPCFIFSPLFLAVLGGFLSDTAHHLLRVERKRATRSKHAAMVEAIDAPNQSKEEEGEEGEVPFQFVRSKRRPGYRPAATRSSSSTSAAATTSTTSTRRGVEAGKERSYSNGSGTITGSTAGFTYSSTGSSAGRRGRGSRRSGANPTQGASTCSGISEQQVSETSLRRANDAIEVFVKYFTSQLYTGSEGKSEGSGRQTFAQQLHATLRNVWPEARSMGSRRTEKGEAERGRRRAVIPSRIVCLGLGSPTGSRAAQVQLALLIVLRTYLTPLLNDLTPSPTPATITTFTPDPDSSSHTVTQPPQPPQQPARIECLASDPVFTQLDLSLLSTYSIHATTNPASFQTFYSHLESPTLLYMPHCDRDLYEHVLSLTYPPSPSPLPSQRVLLLCNILHNYTTFTANLHISSPTLHRLIPSFTVIPLPNCDTTKRSALIHQPDNHPDSITVAQFARLWDRNALRDLAFHWL